MNKDQKKVFIGKIMVSTGKIFETGANVINMFSVMKSNIISKANSYTNTKFNDLYNNIIDRLKTIKTDTDTKINSVDNQRYNVDVKVSKNEVDIVNFKKIGTLVGTFETYSSLVNTTKDKFGNDIYPGDFAELSKHDGDKFSGLYRYNGNNEWSEHPFINYEEANAADEPISQDEVDQIFGV